MSSTAALEDRCNFDELNLPGKLQSLEAAVDTAGVKVTVATYEEIDQAVGVGNLKVVAGGDGSNTAWILTVNTDVVFSRQV